MSSENINTGWISVYRELLSKPIWLLSSPEQKTVLITLLLMANHSEQQWEFKGERYTCKPGQLITSLESIRRNCGKGVTIQNIRTALSRFEKHGFLTNESTKQNRLITICNYESYQGKANGANKASNNQLTNDQQSANNQLTTNNNDNKVNNDNNLNIDTNVSSLDSNPIANNIEDPIKDYEDVEVTHEDATIDEIISNRSSKSNDTDTSDIDYKKFIEFFNSETKGVFGNVRYPISDNRKRSIRARIRGHGKEAFVEVIQKAINSNFLKGDNSRGFTATFDWLIKPTNFEKTLSGNYDNRRVGDTGSDNKTEMFKRVAREAEEAYKKRDPTAQCRNEFLNEYARQAFSKDSTNMQRQADDNILPF